MSPAGSSPPTRSVLLPLLTTSLQEYLGLPYASPPLGPLRFLPPSPASPWSGGETSGLARKPSCPQLQEGGVTGREDCLYLNIATPNRESGELLPVMVFIHGGAFVSKAPGDSLYGAKLMVEQGVLLVTLNYRLGALGWLTTLTSQAPGNLGLR